VTSVGVADTSALSRLKQRSMIFISRTRALLCHMWF